MRISLKRRANNGVHLAAVGVSEIDSSADFGDLDCPARRQELSHFDGGSFQNVYFRSTMPPL